MAKMATYKMVTVYMNKLDGIDTFRGSHLVNIKLFEILKYAVHLAYEDRLAE